MRPGVVVRRLAALLLVVAILGLPIDDLVAYGLLIATDLPSHHLARPLPAVGLVCEARKGAQLRLAAHRMMEAQIVNSLRHDAQKRAAWCMIRVNYYQVKLR